MSSFWESFFLVSFISMIFPFVLQIIWESHHMHAIPSGYCYFSTFSAIHNGLVMCLLAFSICSRIVFVVKMCLMSKWYEWLESLIKLNRQNSMHVPFRFCMLCHSNIVIEYRRKFRKLFNVQTKPYSQMHVSHLNQTILLFC